MSKDAHYYENLWSETKDKIKIASSLDNAKNLVFGADYHKYKIALPVKDQDILVFEIKNKLELPLSYRTYLQYFGAYGAGPGIGTLDFYKDITSLDVSKPSPIEKFKGLIGHDGEITKSHPIWKQEGLIKIGTYGNPTDCFLVVNGNARGEVWSWNYDDFFGAEGSLEEWYTNWIDIITIKLKNYHLFNSLSENMSLSQIENIMGMKGTECWKDNTNFQKHRIVCFKHTPGSITFSQNGKITKLNQDTRPYITSGSENCADWESAE